MTIEDEHHGTCLCQSVQFSFKGKPRFVKDCVCDSCRRAHGATAVCWVGVKTHQFQFESGESSIHWYQSSTESERGFCNTCGTRLLFRSSKWPGEIHMALACITPPHDLLSSGIVFTEEMPSWTSLVLSETANKR